MSDQPAFQKIPRRPPRASDNPRTITKTMRTRVLERDDFKCRRCGNGPSDTPLVVDHVVPVSKGGLATFDNLQTLCQPCNAGKSNSDPHPHDRKPAKTPTASATAWPCGQYFLTGAPRHWQGIVERIPSDGLIVVQLFSWLTGRDTNQVAVPLEATANEGWRFFLGEDAFKDAADQYQRSICEARR